MAAPRVSDDLRRALELLLVAHQRGPTELSALAREFGLASAERLDALLRGFADLDLAPLDVTPWEVFLTSADGEPGEAGTGARAASTVVDVPATNAWFATPPRLTLEQAVLLLVGLQAVAEVDPGLCRAAAGLGAKLRTRIVATAGREAQGLVDALLVAPPGDGEPHPADAVAATLREAADLHRRVIVETWDGVGEVRRRALDPVRVVAHDGRPYLHAWDRATGSAEAVPLHLVTRVEVLEEAVALPRRLPVFEPPRGPSDGGATVRLRLAADAAWVPEYYDATVVDRAEDGSFTLELTAPDTDWLVRLVRRLGALVIADEPLSP